MKNLKDFLNAPVDTSASKNIALQNVSTEIRNAMLVSGSISSKSKAEKFGQEVTKLAGSKEVMSELSDKIGMPLLNESEDQFVARAKQTFKKILMERLSGK
ncbi:hypothetical protein PVK62_16910 [Aliivibrio sp. S3MY1]|uniref:hypothetical protein n=1 Tax=unclassified Aliivibrio TaxID=2645654 RepID=UPI002377DB5D|nr:MULTISPECIES: hypothetical protein [unclassified Aliivibrio]MDD9197505.1 hypothetical protein [Aliivibrio sp. S3MY1]MDD9200764.1 hypothetical protein [Aliivibrio sp. S2MY1]